MTAHTRLPRADGLRMPARFSPHERTYVAWPVREGRWGLDRMRREHAAVIDAIARFEPVTVAADPDVAHTLPDYVTLGERVELLEIPTNDTWIRDNGPIFVTDGRSDNVVQFLRPGVVLAQTVRHEHNPTYALLQDNLRTLQRATDARGRRLEVIEMDILPYTEPIGGLRYPVPYVNYYILNGAAVVPALGGEEDAEGLARMAEMLADREIVTVPSTAMALGGGGGDCITQQQPAGALLQ